jgi:hypothetical protein
MSRAFRPVWRDPKAQGSLGVVSVFVASRSITPLASGSISAIQLPETRLPMAVIKVMKSNGRELTDRSVINRYIRQSPTAVALGDEAGPHLTSVRVAWFDDLMGRVTP